jgi:hypothetical protein
MVNLGYHKPINMSKKLIIPLVAAGCFILLACGSGGKQTPESIAKEWCELNAMVHKADDGGSDYAKAKEALDKYEKDIETKYGKDPAFMDKVEKEVEKCEDESEGR